MDDIISRQAAIDAVCKDCEYYYNENVIQELKDLPSTQPAIIHCRDCKHRRYTDNRIPSERCYVCDHWDFEQPDPNGFCNFAERRTDD